jgi:WD repeat-containing protein 45
MCGLENGYRIYNTDRLRENAREINGGIKHVEMLYRCNYVGLVGGGESPKYSKNKAIIWDDYEKKIAIPFDFNAEVISIKLRRDRYFLTVLKCVINDYKR